ncbi:hypothetical protein HMPREF0045_01134 [Actinomyces graevenitzii C83]|uniref:Exonuclease domain-containing protein n=1 Tax=Actinomyces graevenitzii C83 TaxID=435830 RepID=G9PFY1_9ACTO|nr:3'-5' exonuclease [Actinomyces graevenitzii]EHM88023.1 hypothetical protein HMPREF0045_01134 [Actinomyces graevenitzii C83]
MSSAQDGASQAQPQGFPELQEVQDVQAGCQPQDGPAWQGGPQEGLELYQRVRDYQRQADTGGLEYQADSRGLGYAVVDLETTGLEPQDEAIIEVGVVLLDPHGREQLRWDSLVNPHRHPGPTRIHGITPDDLTYAPELGTLAPALVELLRGRVLVAHNIRFDASFLLPALRLELGAAALPRKISQVCTMNWARSFIDTPSRSLVRCCQVCGIELASHHRAIDDAAACAQLLSHYLGVIASEYELFPHGIPWGEQLAKAVQLWQQVPRCESSQVVRALQARVGR